MKTKCIKCEKVKELSAEELEEVGEFVLGRKLRAIGFLKFLSLDLREVCKDGREHQWEFEEEFDKEVHLVSKEYNDFEKKKVENERIFGECEAKITELIAKKEDALKAGKEFSEAMEKKKLRIKELAYIPDPGMWS